jgi:hypothetical protein
VVIEHQQYYAQMHFSACQLGTCQLPLLLTHSAGCAIRQPPMHAQLYNLASSCTTSLPPSLSCICSMEENRLYLAALKRLLELPANRSCADCGGSGSGARPGWASISCGVFICMRCAGVHRGIGVHVSKVGVRREVVLSGRLRS